ncbi:adenylyl-sulfate kinase [Methylomonas sp. OY6]|uniref:Adenylyl-sulfate kinase n=1 Tax=Methylomonas defluvii TaxID=3045149 RepID=A0ABU4UI04_9GAMM|nr:adenylyl-sulfate kinase [Methylomonas sp. OY6]MDX8128470.1 adenylyl-sulfate kinase [Methylomonas sp. OY6]
MNGHRSVILWFTGLSGAGKSTIAHAVEAQLHQQGCRTYVLDGDNIRHGLSKDLGFEDADRKENIRRIAEVAKLMLDAGSITLTAFISPFRLERELARRAVADGDFIEIYCKCDLRVCEQRDVKGLYQKARLGEIAHFTGISSPYESPETPEIVIDTNQMSIEECSAHILNHLKIMGILPPCAI